MSFDLLFTPAAVEDLDAIYDFIATDNPGRAASYVAEIRSACERLRAAPLMGVGREDLRRGLRTLPLKRRIIVAYEVRGSTVDVLRVFSAGRDYEAIMRDG